MENSRVKENGKYGWVALFRSIRDHWIWEDPIKFQWFVDILFEANHTPKKVLIRNKLIKVKRGETIKSLGTWAKRWGVGKTAVRSFLKLLESDTMIERIPNRETTHLSICNYEDYQRIGNATKTRLKRDPNTNNKGNKGNNISPREFYDSQLSISENDSHYKSFIETLYGNNPLGSPLDVVLNIRDQLSFDQFKDMYRQCANTNENLVEILCAVEDWGNPKKRLTLRGVLKTFINNSAKRVS